jgi:hypothetical protein
VSTVYHKRNYEEDMKSTLRIANTGLATSRLLVLLAAAIMAWLLMGATAAANATQNASVKLRISPGLCVIDVVQNGISQTLQSPNPNCIPVVPGLSPITPPLNFPHPVTSRPDLGQGTPALPFAGADPVALQPVTPQPGADRRSPFAAANPAGSRSAVEKVSTPATAALVAGVGVVLAAAAGAVDLLAFESRMSKAITRRLGRRFYR